MDFKSLLQTMTSLNEAETKVTKTGKVHKGDYGTSYDGDDEKKPAASTEKRGRGRPKKGADDSGEVKSYDTKSLGSVFGGGQKPKKEIGKVSKKHSLKEYIEEVQEQTQLDEAFGAQQPIQVKPASQTNTQVIQQGDKTLGTVTNPQLAAQIKQSIGKGEMTLNPDEEMSEEVDMGQADARKHVPHGEQNHDWDKDFREKLKQYSRELAQRQQEKNIAEGKDQGKPGKNFAKIAKSAGKEYGSKAAGERVAGAVKAKLAKQGKLEESAEEKSYTCVHAKKGKCEVTAATSYDAAKKAAAKWKLNSTSGIDAHLNTTKVAVDEAAKPDFLDVDKDKNKKESFKKAVKDKEAKKKVSEGRDHSSSAYLDEEVAKILAREKPGMDTVKSNDEFYSAIYHELIQLGLMPKAARGKLADEDFIADVASAYSHYQTNPTLDEGSIEDHTQHGMDATPSKFVAVNPKQAPTPFGTDPIQATTDRAINFISGLRKPSNPFSESKTMKDMQVESWASQLDSLLNEGITVSSSQGQQGQPDSVSVTANDADAQNLMQVLRSAGIGGFGGGAEEQPQADAYGVMSQGEEEPTGTGTEPEMSPNVVGDGDDMLSLIKKMSEISDAPAQGSEGGQDYEDEEGEEAGALEPTSGDEEGSDSQLAGDEDSDEEGEDEGSEEDEEVTDEGNAFGQEVRQKKSDNIPDSQQRIKTGGQNLPVKEGEHECNECGMMESGCECDHDQVNEYANDAGGDAMGDAQLMKLKALLSVGNDLHRMKTSQAMGNPVRVTESKTMINEWKKLSGI
jgi:hypothetical protein